MVFTAIDERYNYGEIREISIGVIQGLIIITVVYTERNGNIRIISARKATLKEQRIYYHYLTRTT
ncbi:MAG: BrnT family toxin [Cyanobacteriota bacterium]|nr:BrnT family toxin [Cyanobacteriota bacterium]